MRDTPRRRVVSSRNVTGRPRKVAGQRPGAANEEKQLEAAPSELLEPAEPASAAASDQSFFEGRTFTICLIGLLVGLLVLGTFEVKYLWFADEPTVSAQTPVVAGDASVRVAVEAAARSTEQILSTTYQDYDGQVAKSSEKMTDTFAKEYQETSAGIKDEFIALKTKLQVKAVAQGVVQASSAQVQALLFLNQYVEKEQDGKPATSFAQYRALVTVVHTDHGWLVSNIETQ